MFGLGMPEVIVIFIIILITFGAGKLTQLGSGIGKGIKNFKKAVHKEPKGIPLPEKATDTVVKSP